MKGLGDDLAANAVVFENGAIADEVGFLDTNAGAEADYSSDWATAENGFDTSSAAIYSTFWKAENDDRVIALAGFAAEMGTPWAQFKADLAVAQRDWWVGQEQAYLDWHDDTAGEIDTYQTSAAVAWTTRSGAFGSAETAFVATTATAGETQVGGLMQADRVHAGTMSGAYDTYQQGVASAARNYLVAEAAAQRDLDSGGTQADFDAALASAKTTQQAAMKAAADTYAGSAVTADGVRDVSSAQASLVYAQSLGPAEVQLVTSYNTAEITHTTAETDARKIRVTNIANGNAAYLTQESNSKATAVATLVSTHASPWATFESDKTDAARDAIVTVAQAAATRAIALVNATADLETAQAAARKTYGIAIAQNEADERTAQADARLQRATEEKDVREDYVAVTGTDGVFDEEGGADGGDSSDKTELPTPLVDPLTGAKETADTPFVLQLDVLSDEEGAARASELMSGLQIQINAMRKESVEMKEHAPIEAAYNLMGIPESERDM